MQELETLITFQVVEGEGIGQQLAFWVASFPGSSQLFVAYCTVCEKKPFYSTLYSMQQKAGEEPGNVATCWAQLLGQ